MFSSDGWFFVKITETFSILYSGGRYFGSITNNFSQVHNFYENNLFWCFCLLPSFFRQLKKLNIYVCFQNISVEEYIINLGVNFEEYVGRPLGILPQKPEDSRK